MLEDYKDFDFENIDFSVYEQIWNGDVATDSQQYSMINFMIAQAKATFNWELEICGANNKRIHHPLKLDRYSWEHRQNHLFPKLPSKENQAQSQEQQWPGSLQKWNCPFLLRLLLH